MDSNAVGVPPLVAAGRTRVRPMNARMLTVRCLPLLLSVALAGGALAQSPAPEPAKASPGSGTLRPGDVVKLTIWREKDLSGELTVDENGVVVFPKLGPMRVTEVAPEALRDTLVALYQRYLVNPSIEVTLLRRVTILGAVRKPGVYPVDPTTTIADALALAGGVAPEGRMNRLELRRGDQRIDIDVHAGMRIADSPIQSGDQLYVPERSWLARNVGVVTTLISVASSVAVALILR